MSESWWWGVALAMAALGMFSSNILVTKAASDRVSLSLGFLVAVVVNLLFCLLIYLIQRVAFGPSLAWNLPATLIFIAAGFFSTFLGRWFFFESVARLGSAKASIFQVSSPGFVTLLAWIFMGEALPLPAIAGIVITMAGLLSVAYKPGAWTSRASSGNGNISNSPSSQGLLRSIFASTLFLGLGSSMAYAVGTVLRGAGVRLWNEPVLGALLGAVTGLVLHLATSSGLSSLKQDMRAADRKGVWLYVISGILTITAQVCAIASLRYIPVSLSNLITLCSPLLVIPGSYLIFKNREAVTAGTWLGAFLAIGGIALVLLTGKQ